MTRKVELLTCDQPFDWSEKITEGEEATALSFTKCTKHLPRTRNNIILLFLHFFSFFIQYATVQKHLVPRSVEVKRRWPGAAPLVKWLQSLTPNGSERRRKKKTGFRAMWDSARHDNYINDLSYNIWPHIIHDLNHF